MDLALQVFNVTAPVLLCALAGFFWTRRSLPFDSAMITPLLMYLAVPALLLSNFSQMSLPADSFLKLLLAAAAAHVLFGLFGWLFLRALKLPPSTYLSTLIFGNNGNLGLPLCMLAFGQDGLYLGLGYLVVSNIGMFTAGTWINSGKMAPGSMLKTPTLYAAVISIALGFSNVHLPEVLVHSLDIMGGMAIPLMLLALGASMAHLQVGSYRTCVLLAAFKAAMGLIVGVLLSWIFGLEGVTRDVFMLQNMMPVAMFNYLLAEHYGQGGAKVTGVIMASMLLGLAIIPITLAILL